MGIVIEYLVPIAALIAFVYLVVGLVRKRDPAEVRKAAASFNRAVAELIDITNRLEDILVIERSRIHIDDSMDVQSERNQRHHERRERIMGSEE